jgi:response regulator RpfG family c-di-GMP phosphodiesterase
MASRLHDIGKIDRMDSVLQERDALHDAEWALRTHPAVGADMLLGLPAAVTDLVPTHHERQHRRPQGLTGEEVPIGARIISVTRLLRHHDSAPAPRRPADRPGGRG